MARKRKLEEEELERKRVIEEERAKRIAEIQAKRVVEVKQQAKEKHEREERAAKLERERIKWRLGRDERLERRRLMYEERQERIAINEQKKEKWLEIKRLKEEKYLERKEKKKKAEELLHIKLLEVQKRKREKLVENQEDGEALSDEELFHPSHPAAPSVLVTGGQKVKIDTLQSDLAVEPVSDEEKMLDEVSDLEDIFSDEEVSPKKTPVLNSKKRKALKRRMQMSAIIKLRTEANLKLATALPPGTEPPAEEISVRLGTPPAGIKPSEFLSAVPIAPVPGTSGLLRPVRSAALGAAPIPGTPPKLGASPGAAPFPGTPPFPGAAPFVPGMASPRFNIPPGALRMPAAKANNNGIPRPPGPPMSQEQLLE